MGSDFVYCRHHTPVGIKVEEISGGDALSEKVRKAMAHQIWCENGKNGYRDFDHLECGAPIVDGEENRISVTHCKGLYAVASLPRTPEADLTVFNPRTALGIDAEPWDRSQVLKIRERFLNEEELAMVPADDVAANILAWTAKEAALKAGLDPSVDIRNDLVIKHLPSLDPLATGEILLRLSDRQPESLQLYSYDSEGCCVTLAFSPKCAKFKKV